MTQLSRDTMLKTVLFIFVIRNVEGLIPEDYHDRYIDGSTMVHLRFSKGEINSDVFVFNKLFHKLK